MGKDYIDKMREKSKEFPDYLLAGEDLTENAMRAFLYGDQEALLLRIEAKLDSLLSILGTRSTE